MENNKYFDISALLPHASPMILIHRVLTYDLTERELVAEVDIDEDNMFFDHSLAGVPVFMGMEYMAQSIGALSGIASIEFSGEKPTLGFVLGSRKYQNSLKRFDPGQTYRIAVREIFTDKEFSCFSCALENRLGETCVTAELNVFKPKDISAFLEVLNG